MFSKCISIGKELGNIELSETPSKRGEILGLILL
jgi:hypothetical protein